MALLNMTRQPTKLSLSRRSRVCFRKKKKKQGTGPMGIEAPGKGEGIHVESEETGRRWWAGSTARQGKYRRGEQLEKFKDNCGRREAGRPI